VGVSQGEQQVCLECAKAAIGPPTIFCSKICAAEHLVGHCERLHVDQLQKLPREGDKVSGVERFLVSVNDLYRERVVPIMDDKDATILEPYLE
jgi:hypothetical protein